MSSRGWLLGILAGIAILFFIAASWHVSPWFVWELLPESKDFQLVIDPSSDKTKGKAAATLSFLAPQQRWEEYQGLVRRFGYSTSGTTETLVLVPLLSTYTPLQTALQQDGWTIEHLGWVIRASRGTNAVLPSMGQAYRNSLLGVLRGPYSAHPWAIGHTSPAVQPLVPYPISFRADTRPREVLVTLDSGPLLPGPGIAEPPLTSDVVIFIPSSAAQTLPPPYKTLWEELIAQSFDFKYTKPAFLSDLSTFDHLFIGKEGDQMVMGSSGNVDAFIKTAHGWLQEEERRTRITTRSFRLPDGTTGHERVPGPAQPVLTPSATDPHCFIPLEERTKLFMCWKDDLAVLATSIAAANQALSIPRTSTWNISLSRPWTANLPLPALERLSLSSQGTAIQAHLFFQEESSTSRE